MCNIKSICLNCEKEKICLAEDSEKAITWECIQYKPKKLKKEK